MTSRIPQQARADHERTEAPCFSCKKITKTMCRKCHSYWYCCKEHQRLHWNNGHKETCIPCGICEAKQFQEAQDQKDAVTLKVFKNLGLTMPENCTEEDKDDILINYVAAKTNQPLKPKGIIPVWLTKENAVEYAIKIVNNYFPTVTAFIELKLESEFTIIQREACDKKKVAFFIPMRVRPSPCCIRDLCCCKKNALNEMRIKLNAISSQKITSVYYTAEVYSHAGQRCQKVNLILDTTPLETA